MGKQRLAHGGSSKFACRSWPSSFALGSFPSRSSQTGTRSLCSSNHTQGLQSEDTPPALLLTPRFATASAPCPLCPYWSAVRTPPPGGERLQLQSGFPWPYAVHATYQFEDAADCAFGKRERLREWGMWLADEAEAEAEERDVEEAEAEVAGMDKAGEEESRRAGEVEGEEVQKADGCGEADKSSQQQARRDAAARLRKQQRQRVAAAAAERFLILTNDGEVLAPSAPWNESHPTARSRQHAAHLAQLKERIAQGVLLARALRRTLVLPPLVCYCDKYWAKLTRCTIGEQALATQPLPFRCPMDHVIPISNWHGTVAVRRLRERCSLPPEETLGPAEQGMRYRTHGWLRTAQARRLEMLSKGGIELMPTDEEMRRGDPAGEQTILTVAAADAAAAASLAGLPVPAPPDPRPHLPSPRLLTIAPNLPLASLRALTGNISLVRV